MTNLETQDSQIDPFKRHGQRFQARQKVVTELWQSGQQEEALEATRHKYANTIYQLFRENPDITLAAVAEELGKKSRQFVLQEISYLRELGIPLNTTLGRQTGLGQKIIESRQHPRKGVHSYKDIQGLFRLDKQK